MASSTLARAMPGTGGRAGCEPAADVGMQARVVSTEESGQIATVWIEVSLDPLVTIPEATVEGRLLRHGGSASVPGLESRSLPILKDVPRTLLYRLELARGEDHHLLFTLHAAPAPAEPPPSAHVRVSLDPSLRPQRRGGCLEYRARPGTGAQEP